MSRSAKVARVIPLETPDNSSSEDEDELEELQVLIQRITLIKPVLTLIENVSRSMKFIFSVKGRVRGSRPG